MEIEEIKEEINRRFKLQIEYGGTNKEVNKIKPLVSVTVAAYQHEKYIRQCLDSILMQRTNFPYEIIVGEDDSKDETRTICIEYAKKYPDKIRLFLRDRRLSHLLDGNGNLIKRLNGIFGFSRMSARGKYLAVCEGDDYWTDPKKLEKQVAYLEENPKCGIVFTSGDVYYEQSQRLISDYDQTFKLQIPEGKVLPYLVQKGNPYKTCTAMLRKEFVDDMDHLDPKDWLAISRMDWTIWSYIASKSEVGYLKEPTATYRILESSMSHSKSLEGERRFRRKIYKITLGLSHRYGIKVDKAQLRQKYLISLLTFCVQNNLYKKAFQLTTNIGLIGKLILKEKILRQILQKKDFK